MQINNIKVPPKWQLTDSEFFAFCQLNRDLKLERNKKGQITIGMPTSSKTGIINSEINAELTLWNRKNKSGFVFDSSTGFKLPNNAIVSPDVAWVSKEKWETLNEAEKSKFAPICPDFVIELKSESDSLKDLKEKMQDYIENGCKIAWLIDTAQEIVWQYAENGTITEIKGFNKSISADLVLKGFELDLSILN